MNRQQAIEEVVSRTCNLQSGTTVTNCVQHMGRAIISRPPDCRLCAADVASKLQVALAVNAWLNLWKDDAEKLLRGVLKSKQTEVWKLLKEAADHLDYTGYGDSWEREAAGDLRERLRVHMCPTCERACPCEKGNAVLDKETTLERTELKTNQCDCTHGGETLGQE